jgi:hypothetical protein
MSETEMHTDAINKFIGLANELVNADGIPRKVVSSALMTACAFYSTYVVTGNNGALNESGVEKMTKLFGERLSVVQKSKEANARLAQQNQGDAASAQ